MACLTRRGFVGGLIAAVGGLASVLRGGLASVLPRMKFGRIHVNEHGPRWRVWLNNTEVTDECYEADDQVGYVKLFKQRDGRAYFDREMNDIAGCTRTGEVRIERVKSDA